MIKPFSDPDKQIVPATGNTQLGLTRRELLICSALQGILAARQDRSISTIETDDKTQRQIARAAIEMANAVISESQV